MKELESSRRRKDSIPKMT